MPYSQKTRRSNIDGSSVSGRAELNRRPLRPERSALTGLSHAPNKQGGIIPVRIRFGKLFAV
jgi:hypothetical protein